MNSIKFLVQKHSGTIILTLSLILVFVLLYTFRNILLPFLIGLVLAFIMAPAVSWLEQKLPRRGRWNGAKRIFSIILLFIVVLAILGTAGFYLVNIAIDSLTSIIENAPDYFSTAFDTIQRWFSDLRRWLPDEANQQLQDISQDIATNLGNIIQNLFTGIITTIPTSITYIGGFLAMPIFLFYVLKDRESLSKHFYSSFSPHATRHLKNVNSIINEVLGGYIRAQILMGLAVGILAFIGLVIILDVPIAVGLAVIAGITELVPVLGPWIGGIIAGLVVLAIQPGSVIWVVVIFFAVQLIENNLLVPRIQGYYLHIHPAIAIFLIVIGAAIAGFWGLILAIPLASTIVRLYRYVLQTAREENGKTEEPEPAANEEEAEEEA